MRVPRFSPPPDLIALPWKETGVQGVHLILLHPPLESLQQARAESGTAVEGAVLIRMDPGCGYPPHAHLGVEEVFVLAGGYRDHSGVYDVGTYVRYEAGTEHAPVALGDAHRPPGEDNPPCVLFASARGGIELLE